MSQSFKFKQSDKQVLEKLSGRLLSQQETFEAEQDLLGAFNWLIEMDEKYHSKVKEVEGIC
jgi:hypothetical protein